MMKTFKQISGKAIMEGQGGSHDLPPVLVLKRKAIRQFPNGQKVALYQIDKLNKYITLPYSDSMLTAMPEQKE